MPSLNYLLITFSAFFLILGRGARKLDLNFVSKLSQSHLWIPQRLDQVSDRTPCFFPVSLEQFFSGILRSFPCFAFIEKAKVFRCRLPVIIAYGTDDKK